MTRPPPGGGRRRAAHGKARDLGATITYEAPASAEMRTAPADAADPIETRSNGTFTPAGAAAAARRRWALAKLPDFASAELELIPAEDFAPFEQGRRDLTRETGAELAERSGGLSRATWTVVRGACWLTAFAEYWATKAAQTGDGKAADRAAQLFQKASIERVKAQDMAAADAESRGQKSKSTPILDAIEQAAQKRLAAKNDASGDGGSE